MFKPKDGKSEATKLEEALSELPEGYVITYEAMRVILGKDIQEDRGAFYHFRNRMVKKHGKVLVNVREVGYKIEFPENVPTFVNHDIKRSYRVLDKNQNRLSATFSKIKDINKRTKAIESMVFLSRLKSGVRKVRKVFSKPEIPRRNFEQEIHASRLKKLEETNIETIIHG